MTVRWRSGRVGHWRVIIGCLAVSALLLVPQAFVSAGWQIVVLRFLMGLSLGGLLPCVASVIRHSVPDCIAGRVLGYSVSAHTSLMSQTSTLLLSYPDVLMATVAGLLFVATGVVSARAAQ